MYLEVGVRPTHAQNAHLKILLSSFSTGLLIVDGGGIAAWSTGRWVESGLCTCVPCVPISSFPTFGIFLGLAAGMEADR
eukprot:5066339-Amphidinium_carterae.1